MNDTVQLAGALKHSLVNGPGVRYVVFFQGCTHGCPGCHNPETHDKAGGETTKISDVIQAIRDTKLLDGVTLSGGDPFLQPEAMIQIADAAKAMGLSVWAYSGYTYDQLIAGEAGEKAKEVLDHIDVLVDGEFIASQKSEDCLYRGSTNQRVVDIEKTREQGQIVTLYDDEPEIEEDLER